MHAETLIFADLKKKICVFSVQNRLFAYYG